MPEAAVLNRAALLGYLLLDEKLSVSTAMGALLITAGGLWAFLYNRKKAGMTGVDFVPGVHDAYPGLFNIRIVVSQSIEKCPGSLPVRERGQTAPGEV